MTAHDPILDGERPSISTGLLVQAASRRRIEFALRDIPSGEFADTIRNHLIQRLGVGGADRIINQMAEGMVIR